MRKPKAKTSKQATSAKRNLNCTPELHPAQLQFYQSKARVSAFISGIGGGKSWVGAMRLLFLPPNSVSLVVAPNYRTLTDATQNTFWRVIESCGFPPEIVVDHNKSEQITLLSNGHKIYWRSASDPDSFRGIEVGNAWIDEVGFCSRYAYDVVAGRVRLPGANQIWLTGTPNGKNWVFKLFFEEHPDDSNYELVHARTIDNIFLSQSYYDGLSAQYSSTQAAQELDGEFLEKQNARIKAEWIRKTHVCPTGIITMGVDLASSTSERADWTAATCVVNGRGVQHVLASTRHKLPFHQSSEALLAFAKRHRVKVIYVEGVQYQTSMTQELQRLARGSGIAIKSVRPQGSKLIRFMPLEGRIEAGTITFSPDLPDEFFDELTEFSGDGKSWDDQIDSLVYATESEFGKKGSGFLEVEC